MVQYLCQALGILKVRRKTAAQILLSVNKAKRQITRKIVCAFILIHIAVNRFYPHVAAVCYKIGNGAVGFVRGKAEACFDFAHSLCNCARLLVAFSVLVQLGVRFLTELYMLVSAVLKNMLQRCTVDMREHIVNCGNAHFNSCVTFL